MERKEVIQQFKEIIHTQNEVKATEYFSLDFSLFSKEEELEMDKELFLETWHYLHDQLATGFQYSKSETLTEFLYDVIVNQKITEYDKESKAVARKCVWALADIGTTEAKLYLEKLTRFEDKMIVSFAQKRLDNWEQELARKGNKK